MLLLTVPLCTVVRYCMFPSHFCVIVTLAENLRSERNYTDIFPIFHKDTSTSLIDKANVRLKRFFFITIYPRFCNSILAFHDSILTFITRYSLFITRYSLFSTRYSLFITLYSTFITRYSLFSTHYSLYITRYSLFITRYSTFSFYNSILDFYNSILDFYNSKLNTVKKEFLPATGEHIIIIIIIHFCKWTSSFPVFV